MRLQKCAHIRTAVTGYVTNVYTSDLEFNNTQGARCHTLGGLMRQKVTGGRTGRRAGQKLLPGSIVRSVAPVPTIIGSSQIHLY